jgi:predicted ArsR family transcriptional regulator
MADNLYTQKQKKSAGGGGHASTSAPGLSPQEAGALAHPSRERIAEALGRAPAGLTVAELADRVGLHHNAVRQHLRVLAQAGVIASAPSAPTGRRGRPSARYVLAAPHGVAAVGHRELVRLLLEIVRRTGVDAREIEAFGREQGHDALDVDPGQGIEGLRATLAGLGFAPDEVSGAAQRRAGELDLRLRSCPFKDAVLAKGGELICALHRGLVDGTLSRVAPDARLAVFEPRDPVEAGCRVVVTGLDGGADDEGGARGAPAG